MACFCVLAARDFCFVVNECCVGDSPPPSPELSDTILTTSIIPPPDPFLTCLLAAGDGVRVGVFLIFLFIAGVDL